MDYKDRLPTNDEIKNSLDRYFGFMHSKINILGNLDLSRISKMQAKGWYMQSSKEEIEELVNDFVNIYGFIYTKGETSYSGKLIRGTTTDEAEKMHTGYEIGEILSTSTEEGIAKTFCEYGKAALIRIATSRNLPYVYVEDLKDGNLGNEEEVLILPFSKVKSAQFTSNWQGYKYYDVTLEKEELPEISEERITELKENCISGYEEFTNQSKQYEDLAYLYEKIIRMAPREIEEEKRIYEEMNVLRKNISTYKTQFIEMLKGMCRQREKDIDLQRDEEKKALQEEKQRAEQERLKKLKDDIEGFKGNISEDSGYIQQNTESSVSSFVQLVNKYRNISNILEVNTFNSQNPEYDVRFREEQIIDELKKEVSEEDPNIEYGILLEMTQKYGNAKQLLQEMPELLQSYDENSMADLKGNLNQKVQEMIYRTKFYRLNTEREMLLSEKDTFFNKLLGKTALKKAKIKNIDARINYSAKESQIANSSNSVEEMLFEIYECAYQYNGGVLTEEMIYTEEAIRKVFSKLPDSTTLHQRAFSNQTNGLPVTVQKNGVFAWANNRSEAKRLNEETQVLNIQTENTNVPQKRSWDINSNLSKIYSRFNNILYNVHELVYVDEKQQTKEIDKDLDNDTIK